MKKLACLCLSAVMNALIYASLTSAKQVIRCKITGKINWFNKLLFHSESVLFPRFISLENVPNYFPFTFHSWQEYRPRLYREQFNCREIGNKDKKSKVIQLSHFSNQGNEAVFISLLS